MTYHTALVLVWSVAGAWLLLEIVIARIARKEER